ncbi:MAG TPA: two-component regulator propeller domain-containing protein [Telluria sp.]|nr:two-component regulator propeller domain-containing protein [Telluria sp.]
MNWLSKLTVGVALAACGAGAALAQPKVAAPGAPRVAETFNVGDDVYVRALAVEKPKGALWVGTSKGVHEVDLASGKLRQTFTRASGLANEYVFAIGIDAQGYKWFGTNAGGASRYKDGKWKTFFPMHGLADYWIYSFASQKNGDLWIGTWAGVNMVDLKTMKFKTYVKELINEWVYGLGVDAQDRVWFGTEGGVSMYDGKVWKSWTHKDGLGAENPAKLMASPNTGLGTRSRHDLGLRSADGSPTYNPNYVFSLLVANDQTIWAGTWGGGVSRYDGKKWTNLTTKNGLAGDIVYSIVQDATGALWFGTSGGVSRYDGKNFNNVDVRTGLLDNNVYALAVAPNGDIWAGTKRGVARIATTSGK